MTRQDIKHWLKFVSSVDTAVEGRRYLIHIGDRFIIEVTKIDHDLNNPHSLMRTWKKAGFIKKMLTTSVCVDTYFYDVKGNCWGYYNITSKRSSDGKRNVVDFDYLRAWTPENIAELVAECIRLYQMGIDP